MLLLEPETSKWIVAISKMGKEFEAKRALFSLCCGGNSERSVPACAPDTERALGKAGGGGTVLLAAGDPCSSSFVLASPFLVLGVERNARLWSLAPGCVSSPQTAVVRSGQTVRNSFKGKDSPRSPSLGQLAGVPRPAWVEPAGRPPPELPRDPSQSRWLSEKASQLSSLRHLWRTRFWFPSLAAAASHAFQFPRLICTLLGRIGPSVSSREEVSAVQAWFILYLPR